MVSTVEVPPETAALTGLDTPDYGEAFAFPTDARLHPEEWARHILEGAKPRDRLAMLTTWTALGIRLAPLRSSGQVLGWRILHSDPEAVVLGVHAAIGLTARIVIRVDDHHLMHAMLVRYDRGLGRQVWQSMAPKHRHFLIGLLTRAARTATP